MKDVVVGRLAPAYNNKGYNNMYHWRSFLIIETMRNRANVILSILIIVFNLILSGCSTTCTYSHKRWLESRTDSANWVDTTYVTNGNRYTITIDTVLKATISIKPAK